MSESLTVEGVYVLILVIGGAGFIGTHTVEALLEEGHDVRVLDSLDGRVHRGRVPAARPRVDFRIGDVTDPSVLRAALRDVDAVYQFAAYQDYLVDFSTFFHINAAGTALLYEIIVATRMSLKKIVIASSQAVYGEGKYFCPAHGERYPGPRSLTQLARGDWEIRCEDCDSEMTPMWTVESRVAPHNSYGISKYAQEQVGLMLGRRYDIPTVALRYSIVQGPRQSFRNAYSGALRSFALRALLGRPVVIYEDGEQLRDYVSIHDVVRANMMALRDPRMNFRALNVGGHRQVAVRDLAQKVVAACGGSAELVLSGSYRVGDTRHVFSDVSAMGAVGWRPEVGQDDIVVEYVNWIKEQGDLEDTVAVAQATMEEAGVVRRART